MLDDPLLPCKGRQMHNLDPVHAFRFTRRDGVHMQWKQWCTDETWSRPIQLLAPHEVQPVGAWRPAQLPMQFPSQGTSILGWLNRFEAWCGSQPAGTAYLGLEREFVWLRAAVQHQVPGIYAPGIEVESIVSDLRGLQHGRPGTDAPGAMVAKFPEDIIAQLFPSGDVPRIPADSLVRVEHVTHKPGAGGGALRSDLIVPGSLLLVSPPADSAVAHGHRLPIIVGMAVDTSCKKGTILVAWYVPELARAENYRGGAKKTILDVFGPWRSMHELTLEALRQCRLPEPFVNVGSVLEANFELGIEGTLPYDVLDSLRTHHQIDLTGFSMSQTQRGNLYRQYVLMRGG